MFLTKVIFMLKTLGKIRSLYKIGDLTACRRAACVLCAVQSETVERHVCCVQCRVIQRHVCCVQWRVRQRYLCCVKCFRLFLTHFFKSE